MRHLLLVGAAALALVAGTMAAQAVDVVNEDDSVHEIMVDSEGEAAFIEVLPGDTLTGICVQCILSFEGGESVAVEGDQVAVIKNGKFQIRAKLN